MCIILPHCAIDIAQQRPNLIETQITFFTLSSLNIQHVETSFPTMLISILLFFSTSLISAHVIQPNPQTGSALSPGLSRRATTDNDYALLGITCSTLYGRPAMEDCRGAVQQIENMLGTGVDAARSFAHDLYEFVAPGRQSLYRGRGAGEYHTPLYWRSGK